MSEGFLENWAGLLGPIAAGIVLIITFLINRRIGKKKNLFDERYQQKTNRFKARSWDVMQVVYFIAWFPVIIFDGISFSFFLLTALFVFHNLTAIITSFYISAKEEDYN
ncbi:hypothetical protein CIL05_13025 [Virgibacillus profundi]|uniref:DUF3796 domain-containing protein n=1 Tax=Virgibacillus profundi TaxID=2024555 RepID=A0A2A2ICL1_9BACI|nr:DUF2178 domain-containing protein [Virgibacillus profundi]PAV29312.1 hypothetical protein CIL05_13025 [Virgibacillus profundi]PXY53481.1 DUF2178 domain-containing protein [Virgibacillus profundi]